MPKKPSAVLLISCLFSAAAFSSAEPPVPKPDDAPNAVETQKKVRALFSNASFQPADLAEIQNRLKQAENDDQWIKLSNAAQSYNEFLNGFSGLNPESVSARVKQLGQALGAEDVEIKKILPLYLSHCGPSSNGPLCIARAQGPGAVPARAPPPAPPPMDRATPAPRMLAAVKANLPADFGQIADGGGSSAAPGSQAPAPQPGISAPRTPRRGNSPGDNRYPSPAIPSRLTSGLGREIPAPGAHPPPPPSQAEAARLLLEGLPPVSAGDDFMPPPDRLMAGKLKGIFARDPKSAAARDYLKQYEAFARSGKPDPASLAAWEKEVQAYIRFKEGPHSGPNLPELPKFLQLQDAQETNSASADACWQALNKDHPNFAQWCAKNPKTAAIMAGVTSAVVDQAKGLVSLQNILMILGTLLIGGLVSGGVADVIALLLAIGFSAYMVYKIISEYGPRLVSAIRDLWRSQSGSKESYVKWKETAYFATTTIAAIVMIYLGAKGAQGLATKLSKLSAPGASLPSMAALMETARTPSALLAEQPGILPQAARIRAASPETSVGSSLLTATANTARSVATSVAAAVKSKLPGARPPAELATTPASLQAARQAREAISRNLDGAKLKEAGFAGEETVAPVKAEPVPKTEPPATPQMADNQARYQRALREQFEVSTAELPGKGKAGPDAFVSKLQKAEALPELAPANAPPQVKALAKAAREQAVSRMAQEYLGLKEPPKVIAPKTDPLSGAQLYILQNAEGKSVGVLKVFTKNGKGPTTLMNELAAGREFGAQDVKLSKPVETIGAARLGDSGEVAQWMKAAPGQDYYGVFEKLGELPEGSAARKAALPGVEADVEKVALALAERHNASAAGEVSLAAKQESLSKALANLEGMKGKLPAPLYEAMEARIKNLGQKFLDADVPGRITHGDFHPGNAFLDQIITLIDNETAMESIGSRGEGINSPVADVARFVESIRVNNAAKGINLTGKEMSAIETEFIDSYLRDMKISPEAFQAHLDYYRARLQITALKYAKPETFGKVLDAVKADPGLKTGSEIIPVRSPINGRAALDANALMGALERGESAAVDNALAGRSPVISITAAKEFLVKGDVNVLREFLKSRGGRVGSAATAEQIADLQAQATLLGRTLRAKDAAVSGSAINESIPLLTRDKKLYNFLKATGVPVETY